MKLTLGTLSMSVKYAYSRNNTIYFQRAIPEDLQPRYGSKRVKIKLPEKDIRAAAARIESINRELESEWERLRGNTSAAPKTTREKAVVLLGQWGLDPQAPDPQSSALFHDHLDDKRGAYARGDDRVYRQASAEKYLEPHEVAAAQLLAGTLKPTLADALKLYLEVHPNRHDAKFVAYTKLAYVKLTDHFGDKPLEDITRKDGHGLVTHLQGLKLSTGTIRRLLNSYNAVVSLYYKERESDRRSPFSSLPIPGEGKDKKKRKPFTKPELQELAKACKAKDDQQRWILAMLADTGARLAEVVGLAVGDIKLQAEVPHIVIQPHPWRPLKTPESAREVPLVGSALWAAGQVLAKSKRSQVFAFPTYTSSEKCNADGASATLAKWMRAQGLEHTAHELRHTLADRLRDVQCPEDVRLAIGGWASEGVGNKYGTGYGLRVKAEWLARIV